LLKNNKIYEPARFMDCKIAAANLLESENSIKKNAFDENTKCFAIARLGFKN